MIIKQNKYKESDPVKSVYYPPLMFFFVAPFFINHLMVIKKIMSFKKGGTNNIIIKQNKSKWCDSISSINYPPLMFIFVPPFF